ncbi:hypothetical protein LOTGIDRAFT_164025 [Lottia gigantea]|uniref:Uncharacterized protein n=1 Tax=Lottia gigantea TaxID=225164 RepID=V3ZGU4_LOTGI|nr:hypothetical protein LOTGIDRAFT_164025 [Lottia gigantea]ESO90443.1 hypothetical protein LOTGIDRAFT_164025 [Lottia gigantea]
MEKNKNQPQQLTMGQPQQLTMDQPQQLTMDQPQQLTMDQPQQLTMDQPQQLTMDQPQQLTMDQPQQLTMHQPQHVTMDQPQHITRDQPHQLTMDQPHQLTMGQPQQLTMDQPQQLTMDQPQHVTMDQPQQLSMDQPQQLTMHQPQPVTMGQPHHITRDQPQQLTMDQPHQLTMGRPQQLTMDQPQQLTMDQPQHVTMDQPQQLSMDQPQQLSMNKPQQLTMDQPQPVTIDQPQQLTMDQPQQPTMDQPQQLSMEQPQHVTMDQPQQLTMDQPQHVTMDQPQYVTMNHTQHVTMDQPQHVTMDQPQHVTIDQPHQLTMDQPHQLTMDQPQQLTMDQPQHVTIDQPQQLTMNKPQQLPLDQPQQLTMDKPQQLTMDQPQQLTMDQPQQLTMDKPQQLTMNQPQQLTMDQPQQLTMNQPQQLTMTQPQQLTIHQPQHVTMDQHQHVTMNQPQQLTMNKPQQLTMNKPQLTKVVKGLSQEPKLRRKAEIRYHDAEESLFPDLDDVVVSSSDSWNPDSESSSTEDNEAIPKVVRVDNSHSSGESDIIPIVPDISLLALPDSTSVTSSSKDPSVEDLNVAQTYVSEGKRNSKQNYCLFCSKSFSKMARHFEAMHSKEIDVQRALSFPKNAKERRVQFKNIINRGNYLHNKTTLEDGHGQIITVRRPTVDRDHSNYIPCQYCLGFFKKQDFWRHAKICNPKSPPSHRVYHQRASAALLPVSKNATLHFREKILDKLSIDEISLAARNDATIVAYGIKLFKKCAQNKQQFQYVRQKMRELARLLLVVRKKNKDIYALKDFIKPTFFHDILEATKEVAQFCEESASFKTPSLVPKLGGSLKKCAENLKAEAIITGDKSLKKDALDFLDLCNTEWNIEVSVLARETLDKVKFNKPKRLPLTEDLQILNNYLREKAELEKRQLETHANSTIWRNFAETLLAQLVLFNRRRGGETQLLLLQQFLDGISNKQNSMASEVKNSLSKLELKLCNFMYRVELRGKRGRRVAVLLTKENKQNIELLIKNRKEGGISAENAYLFARPGSSETPIRSCDVLRKFAAVSGTKNPNLITSTALRKHIATISQVMNLKDNELDCLANFMGHDIRIHRQFYRLSEETIQLAKISKLLMEIENGTMHEAAGKTLDEISVTNEETLEIDEEDDVDDMEETLQSRTLQVNNVDEAFDADVNDNCGVQTDDVEEFGPSTTKKLKKGNKKKVTLFKNSKVNKSNRKAWSEEEKKAVTQHLGKFFLQSKLPGKIDCEECIRKNRVLSGRTWTHVKFFIKNNKKF